MGMEEHLRVNVRRSADKALPEMYSVLFRESISVPAQKRNGNLKDKNTRMSQLISRPQKVIFLKGSKNTHPSHFHEFKAHQRPKIRAPLQFSRVQIGPETSSVT